MWSTEDTVKAFDKFITVHDKKIIKQIMHGNFLIMIKGVTVFY